MIYLLYGQPGTGKTTLATGIMLDYLRAGRRVVSNFALDTAPASFKPKGKMADAYVHVLPPNPTLQQLLDIGLGWFDEGDIGREDIAGLLVIDEAGPWLSARTWNDKERAAIIDWFLQSRKRGWDVIFIAQAPTLIDKQAREAVVEGYVRIRRTDRLMILNMIKFPRLHIGIARYGLDPNAPKLQVWRYRGKLEHKCFNSYALFDRTGDHAPYCTLPARLTKWRGVAPGWASWARAVMGVQQSRVAAKPKPKLADHWPAIYRTLSSEERFRVVKACQRRKLNPQRIPDLLAIKLAQNPASE